MKLLVRDIHQSYFVVALCVGVILGTILALIFRINFFASPIWLMVVLIALLIAYIKPRLLFFVVAVICGMLISFFCATYELVGEDYIRQFYNQTVVVTGVIDGDPNSDESVTKFKIGQLKFGESGEKETAGNLYASVQLNEELHRADTVILKGKLLSGFGTYAGYMYKPEIIKIMRPEPGDFVLSMRDAFAERIKSQLNEPENSLGLSYLLGMKTGLPDDLNDNLRVVGLVHIVVASGAHLSILVEIARKVFGKISRFAGLLFSVIFILFFMAMVGFTPSIMRAGIMAILVIMTWFVGRKLAAWRIILIVVAVTLIINPMFIINLGWLLSFASFAGIMILGPKLSEFFYGDRQPKFIASVVITTVAATLMTLPISLYFFGTLSLISVVANLLILPTLPVAMGLTFATGLFAEIPGINVVCGFLTTRLLEFHIGVVNFFAEAKSFLIEIEPYQPWVFVFYLPIVLILIINVYFQYKRKRINKRIA